MANAIRIDSKLRSVGVIAVLSDQFILRGVPKHVSSDDGLEFVARAAWDWIAAVRARTASIEPRRPWENGCSRSFNAKLRDELIDCGIFFILAVVKLVIEGWLNIYKAKRPQPSLRYRSPGSEGRVVADFAE